MIQISCNKPGILLTSLAILFLTPSCTDGPRPGGPCSYNDYPGKATFTEFKPANDDMIEAKFIFVANVSNAHPKWLKSITYTTHIKNKTGPTTQEWLTGKGIITGFEIPCVYFEIDSGPCPPSGFRFQAIQEVQFY